MPEVNYAPDPRPQPPTTVASRQLGTQIYEGKAPTAPTSRTRPAVSYTAAGAISVWDVISGQWVSAGGAAASSTPSEIGSASEPGLALDYFDDETVGALASLTHGLGWGANGVVSGASCISATMADGRIHKRLSLNNGYIGRRMPWGALWNRIMIVLAVRINGGVNITNTNGYIGVCSGTSLMTDVAGTLNFVGARWGDGTGTSTFTAGTKISFFDVPTFRATTKRAGPTITDRGGMSSGHTVSADQGYLSTIALEISRPVFANDASSINYSVAESSTNQTAVQFSHEKDCIRAMLFPELTTTLLQGGIISSVMGASGVTATPFAFDQSTGVFDTINIYWPQTSPLEIAALGVRKIF